MLSNDRWLPVVEIIRLWAGQTSMVNMLFTILERCWATLRLDSYERTTHKKTLVIVCIFEYSLGCATMIYGFVYCHYVFTTSILCCIVVVDALVCLCARVRS